MTNKHPLSRRDFVASTTLGALALLAERSPLRRFASSAETSILYAGSYTAADRLEGLVVLRMDMTTGALERVSAVDAGPSPSFLTLHPNGRTLYAVNEAVAVPGTNTGAVVSYTIDAASGALTSLNDQSSEGTGACYVNTDRQGRVLLVANYASGNVAILPIDATGAIGTAAQVVQHKGTGPVIARQSSAHAHCVVPHPSNRFVFAVDLGIDGVMVYRLDEERRSLTHVPSSDVALPPGTGPRHLVFHPRLPMAYVVGELNSTVTALRCDAQSGALAIAQRLAWRPASSIGANYPADVHVSSDGAFLYVSNRGDNNIAVFSIARDTGAIALVQAISTGGDWPRNFALDPSGRWLLAGNERSGTITVFSRDARSGRLTATPQRIDLPGVACIRFRGSSSWT